MKPSTFVADQFTCFLPADLVGGQDESLSVYPKHVAGLGCIDVHRVCGSHEWSLISQELLNRRKEAPESVQFKQLL